MACNRGSPRGGPPPPKGRGHGTNPANRFTGIEVEPDYDDPSVVPPRSVPTVYLRDASRSVLSRNTSPDVPYTVSLNPYRGCEHGCSYCYARPTHEYLGFSAGLDFETRIVVKEEAASLLRRELSSPRWKPVPVALSGVTDPYQPVERRLRITRSVLEVLREFRNPVTVVTKNHLVTRDTDILADMASFGAAVVMLSIPTLDGELARRMEPRASQPALRLKALKELSQAGIPVGVLVAPVVPGLTDHELPAILTACAEHGARFASYVPIRLPHAVADLFAEWLETHYPMRKDKVLGKIRSMRAGALNDPRFFTRMRGEGPVAEQIASLFALSLRRAGLKGSMPPLSAAAFRVPRPGRAEKAQLVLFET